MLTCLLSSLHVQAPMGSLDKGPSILLKSRKGQRRVHSKLSHEPAWKKVCFGDASNVPRKGLCFVLGGEVPEASFELKLFPISSSHIHMPWHGTAQNETLFFPVNWNIHMCMYVCTYVFIGVCVCVCACVLVTLSCPTFCDPLDSSPPGSSVHGILQKEYCSG